MFSLYLIICNLGFLTFPLSFYQIYTLVLTSKDNQNSVTNLHFTVGLKDIKTFSNRGQYFSETA